MIERTDWRTVLRECAIVAGGIVAYYGGLIILYWVLRAAMS